VCEARRVAARIIEVPAMAGDPRHPAAAGPSVITAALREAGFALPTSRVRVRSPTGDMISDSIGVGVQVRRLVDAAVSAGELPVVLAGSCDVAPAVLAGVEQDEPGVVWIDAHADFNTPRTSISGFWPGMTLAVVVGDCGRDVWSAIGGEPVAAERVLLLGVRSLSPEEESQRLRQSPLRVIAWRVGLPAEDVDAALESLRQEADRVYLHLDLDALDPSIGKGVVDPPVAGGISRPQLNELLSAINDRLTVVGVTVATYTPAKDDGRTLPVAIDGIRRLIGFRR
jgi:arginase